MQAPTHPLAVAPERTLDVVSDGVSLRIHEWGDPKGAPVLLAHGMADHGRGFDMLAPHLAEFFRVVAFDARGHGDSDRVDVYGWENDVLDVRNLIDWLGGRADVVAHSMGGGHCTDAACYFPDRFRKLVNIDGFGPPEGGFQRPLEGAQERLSPPEECAMYFDGRRRATKNGARIRSYPNFDEMVERRALQNPRLSREWLRYFLFHGVRRTEEGWAWKVDPLSMQGMGPWDPSWIREVWQHLRVPTLGITGNVTDAWGPCDEATIEARFAGVPDFQRAVVDDAGHFVHMEHPAETARIVLDYLRS